MKGDRNILAPLDLRRRGAGGEVTRRSALDMGGDHGRSRRAAFLRPLYQP
jgi:hypothetical protein